MNGKMVVDGKKTRPDIVALLMINQICFCWTTTLEILYQSIEWFVRYFNIEVTYYSDYFWENLWINMAMATTSVSICKNQIAYV